MPLHRVRFSIWGMMVAIAIIALLLGRGFGIAFCSIQAVQMYLSRRQLQRLGGSLRLQVVLPSSRRLLGVGVVVGAVLLLAASVVYLVLMAKPANRDMPLSEILLMVYAGAALLFLPWFWATGVEFRERGIVHGLYFWPWESIWMWGWMDLTDGFWLKLRHRFDTYRIDNRDKKAIQAMLEQYLGTVKQRVVNPTRSAPPRS